MLNARGRRSERRAKERAELNAAEANGKRMHVPEHIRALKTLIDTCPIHGAPVLGCSLCSGASR